MPELNAECFPIGTVKSLTPFETLKLIYYAYLHSIMNYGIILGEIHHLVILFLNCKSGLSELQNV
jgi:hypothetical protein